MRRWISVSVLASAIALGLAGSLSAGAPPDTDSDGVTDDVDNCILASNPSQLDTDMDGFGNACDRDFDQNGFAGGSDFGIWVKTRGRCFGDPLYNEDVQVTPTGCTGALEFGTWAAFYGQAPGPSGLACADPLIDVDGSWGGTNNTPCP